MKLNQRTISELIRAAIEAKGMKLKDVSEDIGMSQQFFSNKLYLNTFTEKEIMKIAGILGYEIKFVYSETSDELRPRRKGVGPRVRKVIDGIVYDTNKADAMFHFAIAEIFVAEIYKKPNGDLFYVFFCKDESRDESKDKAVAPIGFESAKMAYERYCNELTDEDYKFNDEFFDIKG